MKKDHSNGIMSFFSIRISDHFANFGVSAESGSSSKFYGESAFYPNVVKQSFLTLWGKYCEHYLIRTPALPDRKIRVTVTSKGLPNPNEHPIRVIDPNDKIAIPIGFGVFHGEENYHSDEVRLDLDLTDHHEITSILARATKYLPILEIRYWVDAQHVTNRSGAILQLTEINRPAEIVVTGFSLRTSYDEIPTV